MISRSVFASRVARGGQLLVFAGKRRDVIDLPALKRQQLDPLRPVRDAPPRLRQPQLGRAPGAVRGGHGRRLLHQPAMQVQQGQVGPLIEKRLLPVLAVEVDELPPERLQGAHGGQLIVDEHPAPALRADLAPEDDLAPVVRVEHGLHDGLVLAGAYQLGGRPPPDEQIESA